LALKVLLVDPSDEWLDSAAKFLKEQMYEVASVNNGKDAQLALYNDKFFAVVLNYSVKSHSGSQVLKFIKTNHPSQRVVMIMEDKELLEKVTEDKLKKMGAMEVACKPFELALLKELLEGHQSLGDLMSNIPKREGASEEEEVKESDDDFTKVRIDQFYSAQAVLFDIFIRLKANHFVKILHAGDQFTKDRIDKYKVDKGVEFLYFHNSDRRKFIQYNNFLAKKLISVKQAPAASKVNLLKNVSEKYLEEVFTVGVKPQVVDQGKEVCENIFNLVEQQDDLYQLLRSYQEFDPNAFAHAFLVSMFSTCIIKQFEWQSRTTIETTAMACLFHDIGKMKLPKELLEKRPMEMNDEELELYKTHPELGAEVVEGNRMINNSIKQIILQHHEHFDGTGYPYGKRGSKILTLSNIVCLADDFVHIMIDEDLKPVDALKALLSRKEMITRYNSMIVENFIKVFVDPAKIIKESKLPSNSKVINKKVS
jgi:response regulator RpfG family c-di-GMP phosphodiesterase